MIKETKISAFILAVVFFCMIGVMASAENSWAAGDVAKGKKIFGSNCATCHGDKGDGKGMAAAAMNPKPRNFTDANEMKGIDDARLHKSITDGRPGTAMVAFKGSLKPADIDNVIAYIKTFMKK